jgi:dTDP-4-amino-4,6-dideoxygalactose transaminase
VIRVIRLYKVYNSPKTQKMVAKTLRSGWVGEGLMVSEFEGELEHFLKTSNLLAVNSCTSAMMLALRLIKQEEGEVITSPFTCIAVASAIKNTGNRIRWADIEPYTFNMDLDRIEPLLNDFTVAVLVPYFCGQPVDLNKLYNLLRKHYNATGKIVYVIEDCAHAFGAEYKETMIGSHHKDMNYPHENSIKCFSFGATKLLNTGDGGAIVLPNEKMYERAKDLRWYGLNRVVDRYIQEVDEIGFKFHMNDVTAAIGLANIESAEDNLAVVDENRQVYDAELKPHGPVSYHDRKSACPLYPIRVQHGRREDFEMYMVGNGVHVRQPHTRLDKHPCLPSNADLYGMDEFCDDVTCIPAGWWVTEKQRNKIIKLVKEWFNE